MCFSENTSHLAAIGTAKPPIKGIDISPASHTIVKIRRKVAVICVTSSKKEGFIVENSMQKRYGLFTAISMVVGIVIGSGIF